ncbi:Post-transcriptional regulator [Oceanobacillus limi]|uniref:Post-transcriptional regulator n=1 Tax=Oceanobacillus limi TaxID=930131 RepID=A0A1I0H231_9BACI|nr:post-transcriptional regulator [Oceanobacillus limi]SET77622.1 Post-transcriptional regulator [Oceanobacillus limi]
MELVKTVEDWKAILDPVLESKAMEFQMMGYSHPTNEEIWNCLTQKVWKGNPDKRIYEVVQDVLHLSSNIYMSYITVNAYQDEDLMASIAALTEGKEVE